MKSRFTPRNPMFMRDNARGCTFSRKCHDEQRPYGDLVQTVETPGRQPSPERRDGQLPEIPAGALVRKMGNGRQQRAQRRDEDGEPKARAEGGDKGAGNRAVVRVRCHIAYTTTTDPPRRRNLPDIRCRRGGLRRSA